MASHPALCGREPLSTDILEEAVLMLTSDSQVTSDLTLFTRPASLLASTSSKSGDTGINPQLTKRWHRLTGKLHSGTISHQSLK